MNFVTFWQSLATFANVSHFFCQSLATCDLLCYHVTMASSNLVISSYFHLIILLSCPLSICQSDSLQICQLVNLLAFQLAHLGACELVYHSHHCQHIHYWQMIIVLNNLPKTRNTVSLYVEALSPRYTKG